ncbi:MAG TPA: NADH-quinone oxidoreductase subunit J, partial [Candidatus Eremiobacteraeota bacterium]|nr:NADH-quinone oxidoreductase subunit J [Candidatus Eremiobacteraeota bacterium]
GITIIGKLLLSDYVLSFELISVILTVTMIGAIILVKKEESPCL